MKKEELSCV